MGVEEISIPREIEADGYITRKQDLRSRPLERVSDNTANPAADCPYPNCEACSKYFTFDGERYCTVPMVITKQIFRIAEDEIKMMRNDIENLKEDVGTLFYYSHDVPRG